MIAIISDFELENDCWCKYGRWLINLIHLFFQGEASILSTLVNPTQMLLHESMSYRPSSGTLCHG